MIELLVVIGLVAGLVGGPALIVLAPWDLTFGAGVVLLGIGNADRRSGRRLLSFSPLWRALKPGGLWWLHPTALHGRLSKLDRPAVLSWFWLGAVMFGVAIVGCFFCAVGVVRSPMKATSETGIEAQRILKLAGDPRLAYELVERQLAVLVIRAQVILSLSGIVITVTGFSGRAIAQVNLVARLFITIGMFVVLAAAAVVIVGVLRVNWLSSIITDDPLETLERGLIIRDQRTRYLTLSLILWVSGFSLYCVAVAQLLLASR